MSDKELCVEFSSPAGKNTSLRLASASSGLALKDCPVAEGARNAVVPLAGIQDKLATVILVESGKQTESVKVVK